MALHMLVQVAFLSKAQTTIQRLREWAREGPFTGVNAKVVIKIVKLLEILVTASVIALYDLQTALRLGVLVLDDAERASKGIHADGALLGKFEELSQVRILDIRAVQHLHLSDVNGDL